MNPHILYEEDHLHIMDKIEGRANLNHEEYVEDEDDYYYDEDNDDLENNDNM